MQAPGLIAFEEFDAAVFNAIHGYYRQAFNCMRNVLETLAIAAGLAVTKNAVEFDEWRNGKEIFIGKARRLSPEQLGWPAHRSDCHHANLRRGRERPLAHSSVRPIV